MSKIKVMTVFGTRPEAIKMAPLVLELEKHPDEIEAIVCVTAQHRQMLDQVLEIFGITPDYDLDIMKERQTLVGITSRVLEGLDNVIKEVKPDIYALSSLIIFAVLLLLILSNVLSARSAGKVGKERK